MVVLFFIVWCCVVLCGVVLCCVVLCCVVLCCVVIMCCGVVLENVHRDTTILFLIIYVVVSDRAAIQADLLRWYDRNICAPFPKTKRGCDDNPDNKPKQKKTVHTFAKSISLDDDIDTQSLSAEVAD